MKSKTHKQGKYIGSVKVGAKNKCKWLLFSKKHHQMSNSF